ncbi:MAG TPA: carboxylating nicotinate-nucleotide diphosphorylase [Clostridiaceae bacterium]|jgi:nicotinate-nucleotide pyrophosphorylase (carboxylating)|nr:carboxylating nicotinate-nucleotide diphosphorylase [Clostridiaceae bacterium]
MLSTTLIDKIIENALMEDMPYGDITTDNLIPEDSVSEGYIVAKEPGVIAGIEVAERVFHLLDKSIQLKLHVKDGDYVNKGDIILEIKGNTRAILKGERTALNLFQRMCGIATLTYRIKEQVRDLPVRIVDTRKTVPGLRYLDKYSVRCGGGHNHRLGLSDAVLIKDNHINASGGIKKAVEKARESIPHTMTIEVETTTMEEVQEALDAGADIIMLDNMNLEQMKQAVELINKRALVEASGNITMETVRNVALTGVDIISIGALTHSVKAMDLSLKLK